MTDGDTRTSPPGAVDAGGDALGAPDAPTTSTSPLRWWKEALIAGGFYLVYTVVRNQFGSGGSGDRDNALNHA